MEEILSTINRKHYSPEEKVVILRKHLLDQVPISTICDEYHLQPTVFYRWRKEFFENGAAAFQRQVRPQRTKCGHPLFFASLMCAHILPDAHGWLNHVCCADSGSCPRADAAKPSHISIPIPSR
jgi:hypothetical protein